MKKKMNDVKHGERNFGIFLVILEIMVILGACNNDSGLPKEFFRLLGFLLPGIIGVLFIIRDYTKKTEKDESYQCPECKNEIEIGTKKCKNCGCKLDWSDIADEDKIKKEKKETRRKKTSRD